MLVAAVGTDAVSQALDPDSSLVDSDRYRDAADELGDDFGVTAYLDFEPMLQLLESIPEVRDVPDFRATAPYLQRLEHFIAGIRPDDEHDLQRLSLAVREAVDGG